MILNLGVAWGTLCRDGVLASRWTGRVFPALDPARAPTATTSKYWGVTWNKRARRWKAEYTDANHKRRAIGYYDTEEAAAHAVNAAIGALPPDDVKRHTNPVVEGQLVPKPSRNYQPSRKRPRVEDPAAAPPRRSARRSRQE